MVVSTPAPTRSTAGADGAAVATAGVPESPRLPEPVQIDLRAATVDLVSLAHSQIFQEILDGTLPPGAPIRVDRLAKRYNISHTPVKQAIAQLVGRGIVEHSPNRGMRVRVLSEAEFRDVVGARLMSEVHAVRDGLSGASQEALARVLDGVHAYERATRRRRPAAGETGASQRAWHDALIQSDSELHAAIVALAGNERISAWHAHLNILAHGRRLLLRRDLRTLPESEVERSADEHRRIGEAITARDATLAETLIREHIATQLKLGEQGGAL